MNRNQLNKQLALLAKDLNKADKRMKRIADKLGIDQNIDIKKVIDEVRQLIEIGDK